MKFIYYIQLIAFNRETRKRSTNELLLNSLDKLWANSSCCCWSPKNWVDKKTRNAASSKWLQWRGSGGRNKISKAFFKKLIINIGLAPLQRETLDPLPNIFSNWEIWWKCQSDKLALVAIEYEQASGWTEMIDLCFFLNTTTTGVLCLNMAHVMDRKVSVYTKSRLYKI